MAHKMWYCLRMCQTLKDRGEFFRAALGSKTAKFVLGLFCLVGVWDTVLAQLLPQELADKLPTIYDVAIMTGGLLSWYWWVIIGLIILSGIVVEYGVRKNRKINGGKDVTAVSEIRAVVPALTPAPEKPSLDLQPVNHAYEWIEDKQHFDSGPSDGEGRNE